MKKNTTPKAAAIHANNLKINITLLITQFSSLILMSPPLYYASKSK